MVFGACGTSVARLQRTGTSTMDTFPPIIDLGAWRAGTMEERRAIASKAESIFSTVGFCQLVNHGLRPGRIREVFEMMSRLFALPLETKMGIAKAQSRFFRGYEGVMSEVTNGKWDYREQVDTWTDMPESIARWPLWERLKGPSQYLSDEQLPGYRRLTEEFMQEMAGVGQELLRVLATGLGLPEEFLVSMFGDEGECLHRLKWIHSPEPPEGQQPLCGVHEHKDSGFLTLVLPWQYPGLEVERVVANSAWFEPVVLASDDAIVVNIGKSLQALTGNYLVATTHRVVHHAERFSAAFFFGPRLDLDLNPVLRGERYRAGQEAGARRSEADAAVLTSALSEDERVAGDLVVGLVSRSYPQQAARYLSADPCARL
eukprot:TRINITY_DN22248_c0_g2_i1.p1 TRINITY_DN22248_c0_g2~~TRINITY_DN22248_c0_g2_i1.p1  ORF type:complete len:373 (-),score=70.59 TRINITY_DN22248_c0_g2_i1:95-1213(-)